MRLRSSRRNSTCFFYSDRLRVESAPRMPLPVSVLWDKAQEALGAE